MNDIIGIHITEWWYWFQKLQLLEHLEQMNREREIFILFDKYSLTEKQLEMWLKSHFVKPLSLDLAGNQFWKDLKTVVLNLQFLFSCLTSTVKLLSINQAFVLRFELPEFQVSSTFFIILRGEKRWIISLSKTMLTTLHFVLLMVKKANSNKIKKLC